MRRKVNRNIPAEYMCSCIIYLVVWKETLEVGVGRLKSLMKLVDGLSLKNQQAQLRVSSDGEYFVVEERELRVFRTTATTATYKIPLKNIITTITTSENELVEQDKSVIGRGVVGGVIFGPVGLVLGGLSGVGKKKSMKQRQYFIVSYLSADGEICNVTFLPDSTSSPSIMKKFNKYMLKELDRVTPNPKAEKLRSELEQEEEKSEYHL